MLTFKHHCATCCGANNAAILCDVTSQMNCEMQKETAALTREVTRALMLNEPVKPRAYQLLPKQDFGFEPQLLLKALAKAQWIHFEELGMKEM